MYTSLVLLVLLAALISYVGYSVARFYAHVLTGESLVLEAVPFTRSEGAVHMLVLGDSTAVGVGSSPEDSVPGRLSRLIDASVENRGKSGARTYDIAEQLKNASRERYDIIHIQIGANDVIHFGSLAVAEKTLNEILPLVRKHSDKVILLTAGRIGDAPIFPWPVNLVLNKRTADLRQRFMSVTTKHGVVYVDIYSRPDPFGAKPEQYYAPDMLHLTGDGYGYWFGIVEEYVRREWPELVQNP